MKIMPKYAAGVVSIVSEGDPIGAVIILSKESDAKMGDLEMKISDTAASFLGKQMED